MVGFANKKWGICSFIYFLKALWEDPFFVFFFCFLYYFIILICILYSYFFFCYYLLISLSTLFINFTLVSIDFRISHYATFTKNNMYRVYKQNPCTWRYYCKKPMCLFCRYCASVSSSSARTTTIIIIIIILTGGSNNDER